MPKLFEGQVRFGIHAGPQHTTYADYISLWKTVENLGYDWASVLPRETSLIQRCR